MVFVPYLDDLYDAANTFPITPRMLFTEIQQHLLEPATDGQTFQLWSFHEVMGYLTERVSRFLLETRMVKDRTTLTLTTNVQVYDLDANLVDLYRVYSAGYGVVHRTDEWAEDLMNPTWTTTTGAEVQKFIEDQRTPLSITVIPIPNGTGTGTLKYHLIKRNPFHVTIANEADFPAFIDRAIRVPAIFSWGIKYGIMADMLNKQGEANDPERAQYCEQRWQDCIDLAKLFVGESVESGEGQ